ncbi:thioredoxin [Periweissella fabaria]|uniref:Thioredoxin n=1 Tax=Periweissella fabaria TaxID=546157 RepID=A0ABN8BLZ5_9LACO|nr:thioredoxin [Periweissella fabaria]MCM0597607.1 thioredoxin [Periweissella fabaria]CAH0416790.1 Thiol-disulfide oxidoreductase ResA [Periweissella fabaria]
MAIEITQENLQEATANGVVVVDFWADWCGPCKIMNPILDNLETEFTEQITFGKVNVDGQTELAEEYHVMSIPSLVIFQDGVAKEKISGLYPQAKLSEYLAKKVAEYQSTK